MNRVWIMSALMALLALPETASAAEMAHEDAQTLFHVVRLQIDGTRNDEGGFLTWEGSGSIGGDMSKLVLRTEGEIQSGHVERSELWALYSRSASDYWDLQLGMRQDLDPRPQSYLVLGFAGLAPYFIETSAHAFVSKDGDISMRLEQSLDLLLTQSVILTPHLKLDLSANNVPEQHIGSGISRLEAGTQLRYEITRKFAPYLDLVYERSFGNTARLIRADGGDPGNTTLRAGVSFWF